MKRSLSVFLTALLAAAVAAGSAPAGLVTDIAGNGMADVQADSTTMAEQLRKSRRQLPAGGRVAMPETPAKVAYVSSATDTRLYGGVVYSDAWSSRYAPFGIYTSTVTSPLKVET